METNMLPLDRNAHPASGGINSDGEVQAFVIGKNGGLDVNLQDQTSKAIILKLMQELTRSTLSIDAVRDEYTITVADGSTFNVGTDIRIVDTVNDKFYNGKLLSKAVNVLTLDTPLDFDFSSGSQVVSGNTNLNVDGSITPVIFDLRQGAPSISNPLDITRIILSCTTNSAVDLNKFGDLNPLIKGLVMRKKNGTFENLFNFKTNKDMVSTMYDFNVFQASNPSQGIDGFAGRLTFAGQNKLGVSIRVEDVENLQVIVQDDLTGLVEFVITVEGHVVE